jgi:tetratricopeptide (TPR) repeat protein
MSMNSLPTNPHHVCRSKCPQIRSCNNRGQGLRKICRRLHRSTALQRLPVWNMIVFLSPFKTKLIENPFCLARCTSHRTADRLSANADVVFKSSINTILVLRNLNRADGDPLRDETMYHLIESDAREAAQSYWRDESGDDLQPAFDILSQTLLASDGEAKLPFVLSLLGDETQASSDDWVRFGSYLAGQRLLQFTELSRLSEKAPRLLLALLGGMRELLQQDLAKRPSGMTEEVLYRTLQNLARLHADLDDNDAAADALEAAAKINDRHAEGRKRALERSTGESAETLGAETILYHQTERDRMLNFQLLGNVHRARNDPEKATAAFERARQIAGFFLDTYPESMLAATDIASCRYLLGVVAFDRGDIEGALAHFDAGLKQVLRQFKGAPTRQLENLTIDGERLVGRAQARLWNLKPALDHYARSVKLAREWARSDPGDSERQWKFLGINDEAADFLGLVHAPKPALICYNNGLETCIAMLNAGHDSRGVLQHAQRCYQQKAIVLEALGDAHGADVAADHAKRIVAPQA